jgi:hypothetical protein
MANGVGQLIEADDYNTIRNKIANVVGTGAGNSGYGQTVQSSLVNQGAVVTADQWNLLKSDIFNALLHQDGTNPTIVDATVENVIKYGAGEPNFQYNTLADRAIENRFNLGAGQFAVELGATRSETISWSNSVSSTVTVNFNTADQARYFFNSGGKVRFTSTRTGGSATTQNSSWTSLLSAVGTRSFDANSQGLNFYNLTSTAQNWIRQTPSGTYSDNEFRINVSCNVTNNSTGTATQLTFEVVWTDSYTDPDIPGGQQFAPDDVVDGTLSLDVDQVKPVGVLQPTGSPFLITGPSSYSMTSFVFS